jgi:hypothetical protein
MLISVVPILIAVLLQLPSPSNQPVQKQDPGDQRARAKGDSGDVGPSESSSRTNSAGKQESEKRQDYPSETFAERVTAVATVVYALAAAFTLVAIYRQGVYMKRGLRISIQQTRIALKGANAAKQSAEAAWLAASLAKQSAEAGRTPDVELVSVHLSELPLTTRSFIRFQVKNHAKGDAVNVCSRGWVTGVARDTTTFENRILQDWGTLDKLRGGDVRDIPIGPLDQLLDFSTSQRVFAMDYVLVVHIEIIYTDIFKSGYPPISYTGVLLAGKFKKIS